MCPCDDHQDQQAVRTFSYSSDSPMMPLLACFSPRTCRIEQPQIDHPLVRGNPRTGGHGSSVRATWRIDHSARSTFRTSVIVPVENAAATVAELTASLKRAFGPEGLRHFCGALVALYDGYQTGHFVFDVNAHLDILGYARRSVNGAAYHHAGNVSAARETLRILSCVVVEQEYRTASSQQKIRLRILAASDDPQSYGASVLDWEGREIPEARILRQPLDDGTILAANPAWHSGVRPGGHRFTHQIRKIAQENARQHGIALLLGLLFPVKFRMNRGGPVRVRAQNLMSWANLEPGLSNRHRMRDLAKSRAELDYMVSQGYLGGWQDTNEGKANSLDRVYEIGCPHWLSQELRSTRGEDRTGRDISSCAGSEQEAEVVRSQ